ncbi:MAG: tetratricopeptide repeat protein [Acidobacteria bacterium]|nr:tetratricopeptide repeat protein [Acidobacteriota bacterium]
MAQSRIDIFAEMLKQQPEDAMVWYGLASEYFKAERWGEAAEALRKVVNLNRDYTAAYQMLGTALINQGRIIEARRAWADGVEAADRTGAWKARQHMEGLLEGAGGLEADSGFCE